MYKLEFTLLLTLLVANIYMADPDPNCMLQDNCKDCLNTNLNCAWCTDKKYEIKYRCLTNDMLLKFGCARDTIYRNDPRNEKIENIPLSNYETIYERATQVQPQKFYIKLVKSKTENIKFTYRAAKDNPLDLYVLMDLTWTMRDDKETLVSLGAELAEALRSLTANYRLGFGSYADKPVMPMIMEQLSKNPCGPEHYTCEPTYSFRHHLSLTDDITAFVMSVNQSRITGNLDNLEGGLDALMQVIVCPKKIGWKENARKIVILVTDGFLHIAGDGLLAGIIKPNSKKCFLDEKGEYTESLQYDYPSIEEIYRELLKRKTNVIFAVTSGVVDSYQQQSLLMKDISNVEILSTDSSNILELIKKSYESFSKRAQFTDNSPSFIDLKYYTDCGGQFSSLREINNCKDIQIGKEVDFYVNITLRDYPKDDQYNFKIRIEESSINQYVEIDVEIQAKCPCDEEKEPFNEEGRFMCSEHGFMHCGMCICDDDNWTGQFCSCPRDSLNFTQNTAIEDLCRPVMKSLTELGPICSKHGECDCGKCYCFPGYNGKYCECPECDADCNPERADCHCGKCVCKYGWSGNRCNCKESTDGCIAPSGDICSGRGSCECGKCDCQDPYKGKFCEIGSEADNLICSFYEPCVICLIQQKTENGACENITELCTAANTNSNEDFNYAFVAETIDADVRCLVRLKNQYEIQCDHYFTYQTMGTENYLLIQISDCQPISYGKIAGFILMMTFILGALIILFIWCCIRMKDEREYARFEKEQRNSILNESPLYKDPVTHYEVPKKYDESTENPFL